ncbi:hypothetical protein CFP56_026532 [Quercus suber]|uniref:Uncharacterized protein n=1 Tax=Quercus suber TaxID=58331 RepID=A0AAW0K029_QUESU
MTCLGKNTHQLLALQKANPRFGAALHKLRAYVTRALDGSLEMMCLPFSSKTIGPGMVHFVISFMGPSIPATSPLRLWMSETPTAIGTSTLYPLCYPNMSVISSMLPSNPSPPYKTTCPHGTTLLTASLNLDQPTSSSLTSL